LPIKVGFYLTDNQLKVISSVLSNLAAAWFGSILVLPGLYEIKSIWTFLFMLTYSLCFGILSMLAAAKIEDYLYGK